ncbi:MAG: DUF4286 family protein [Polaribacter sp.]|nr:DUF4286 family protein [Polaribacter sp.]
MYIYNVTINVDDNIKNKWLTWIETHILDVLNTGKFISAKLTQVMVTEEMGGTTYAVQYFTESKEKLEDYYKNHAPRLREEGLSLFGDKMLAFRTELEVFSEHFHSGN